MEKSQITIVNWKEVQEQFKKLDITKNKNSQKRIRTAMKAPFYTIRRQSKATLKSMMATSPVSTGNLAKGLSIGSKFTKRTGYFTIAYGGRGKKITAGKSARPAHPNAGNARSKRKGGKRAPVNHFHLINSGTIRRYHSKSFKATGSVGNRKTKNNPLINPNFKTGFTDEHIRKNINAMSSSLYNELKKVYDDINKGKAIK